MYEIGGGTGIVKRGLVWWCDVRTAINALSAGNDKLKLGMVSTGITTIASTQRSNDKTRMKPFVKILLGLGLFSGLILMGGYWILSGAPMPAIAPARTPPPAGFDAALYPEFSTVTSTDQANVVNFAGYGEPFEHYLLTDLAVTYFMFFTETSPPAETDTNRKRIVFVNKDGKVIGDITDVPQMFPMGNFMVTPNAYYAVSATGVSKRQMMTDVSSLPVAQLIAMVNTSTHYRSFVPSDLPENDIDRADGRTVHVMRHDGIWKRAALAKLENRDWKGAPFDRLDSVYQISRAKAPGDRARYFGSPYRVELTHFDQREFLPERGAPFGSPTGIGQSAQWLGTGYYTVFEDDAPILRFRINDDSEIVSGPENSQLLAEGNAKLDFITLTHRDSKGQEKVMAVGGR
jgi:hypothetical protein